MLKHFLHTINTNQSRKLLKRWNESGTKQECKTNQRIIRKYSLTNFRYDFVNHYVASIYLEYRCCFQGQIHYT